MNAADEARVRAIVHEENVNLIKNLQDKIVEEFEPRFAEAMKQRFVKIFSDPTLIKTLRSFSTEGKEQIRDLVREELIKAGFTPR